MPDASGPNLITLVVNGRSVTVPQGSTVAAVLLNAGVPCRISQSGEPRVPLCGMGVCFECRAAIDGVPHRRTCQIACRPGMAVETQP